ncbi:MAG: ABC transporter ATP-binding protein [Melioribacteraceae bacterium]|jgi:ABC-type multidrug transport system ATPase subunit|nr:ABC transporter ATP-binding protein [Melioribacteraceae bacterium]
MEETNINSEIILQVKGLTKKYGSLIAVNNLELNAYRGEVIGFLGPNGAGKSTTIRMLLGLIKPTSGSIEIFGKSLLKNRLDILKRVGAIVEKPDFYLYLSAYKNLEILGKISGMEIKKKRIKEVLEIVGLKKRARSKVQTYSFGMKQRLGIAQALLHNPELIILDEPTTGLDPQGIKEIRELILHLSYDLKKTIFLSSHILKEIEIIASRMIIINNGTTQIEGKVEDLLNSSQMKVRFEVDNTAKALEVVKLSMWNDNFVEAEKNILVFEMDQVEIGELNKFLVENNIIVSSVVPIRSLEDYFLKITEGSTE